MLLLTRRKGEKIIIGQDISLCVKWIIDGEIVQFKLDAPPGTKVSLSQRELPTESVEKPVVKWKRALSRLTKMK